MKKFQEVKEVLAAKLWATEQKLSNIEVEANVEGLSKEELRSLVDELKFEHQKALELSSRDWTLALGKSTLEKCNRIIPILRKLAE